MLKDTIIGKTLLIIRFCDLKFNKSCASIIGVNTKIKYSKYNDIKIKLEIWDRTGQEKKWSLAKNCYKDKDGKILLYGVINKKLFILLNLLIMI